MNKKMFKAVFVTSLIITLALSIVLALAGLLTWVLYKFIGDAALLIALFALLWICSALGVISAVKVHTRIERAKK